MTILTRRNLFTLAVAAGTSTAGVALTGGSWERHMRPAGDVAHQALPGSVLPLYPYGPTGRHWPTRTPSPTGPFQRTIEVDCNWPAISGAIAVAAKYPSEQARIIVRPGTLGGNGNGSGSTPVISNVGAVGRASRILIVPKNGYGSVAFSNSFRLLNVRGVTFAGFSPLPHGLNLSGVQDFAWAFSRGIAFNITSRGAVTENVEFVECVTPDAGIRNFDTWAFRTGEFAYRNITVTGCYLAPAYKAATSSEHVDTLQLSGSLAQANVTLRETVVFASTNVGIIPSAAAQNVLLDSSLVVAGDRMLLRYPLPAGANKFTSGYPTGVNGLGTSKVLNATNSIVVGAVRGQWANVTATQVMSAPGATAASGGFTVTPSLGSIDSGWIDARTPYPTDAYLRSIWASARA